jgi:hypothetical protein
MFPAGDSDALVRVLERLIDDGVLRSWLIPAGRDTALRYPASAFASACADEIEKALE